MGYRLIKRKLMGAIMFDYESAVHKDWKIHLFDKIW